MRTLSPQWRRVLIGSWIAILVLTVALVILYVDNKRTRACIAGYMVADQRAASARGDVAERERQAFKGVLRTIATDPDPQDRLRVIVNYVELLDKNDTIRRENPIPSVPTDCD